MRHHRQLLPRAARRGRYSLALVLGLGVLVAALFALAACGATRIIAIETPHPTPTGQATGQPTAGKPTPPAQTSYAYLYSRIDYPLQIKVESGDTLTLTLSPYSSILTVAPAAGSGATTAGSPIPLPTDLQDYNDIGASVDTISNGSSPITWQLISAPRQSLLNDQAISPRAYLDNVTFHWHVQAVSAGQNTVQLLLHIYYVYLDGSEHDGTIQVSQSAIPMVAVALSPLDSLLPSLKVPLAGLSWLAGIIGVIRFFYGAFKAMNDVTEPVKDAAHVAHAVHTRLTRTPPQQPQPQPPRK